MRVALYARVSTNDKGQTPDNQLRELRAWAKAAGHEVVREYVEHQSGRKAAAKRSALAAMLQDAHKRTFDMVATWALDRLSREGMVATIGYLQALADAGVSFHSYTEPHLSTDNELVRNILLALMSSIAKAEAERLGARTRAGMARAKAAGKRIGRKPLEGQLQRKIEALGRKGLSAYAVAKALEIDRKTAAKYLEG